MKSSTHILLIIAALLLNQFASSQTLEIEFDGSSDNITVCANNLNNLTFNAITDDLDNDCLYAYSWSIVNGNGTLVQNVIDSLAATYSFSGNPSGTITIKIEGVPSGEDCEQDDFEDTITITVTNTPIVNAGGPYSVCANNAQVSLNGSVNGATGGSWSGGNGTFSNVNQGNATATYTPTADEISAGNVTLTLTSTGNGNCNAVSQNTVVSITVAPVVNPGGPYSICANNAQVSLNGSVNGATGGSWSGGNGTFSNVNQGNATATYTPTADEISAGNVTLTLTSTGNGNCNAVSQNTVVSITVAPVLNPGGPYSICANNAQVSLNGSVNGATGGTWSGGNGTFSNVNQGNATATYTPTADEISAGNVTLTLTSTGNGNCNAVSQNTVVSITVAPVVNPGGPYSICANNAQVSLNGSVNGATGGTWSGGNGTFSNVNQGNATATYTPTADEISAGNVTLTLTSTGNGNCNAVSQNTVVSITLAPVVNPGGPYSICANNAQVSLNGSVNGATGGTWSGGNGTFSNVNQANATATYTPTAGEISTGNVSLTLTSTGNGNCNAVSQNIVVSIAPAPAVDAGGLYSTCTNQPEVELAGEVTNAGGGQWSGGLGSFDPSNTDLNATYTPSTDELESGSVTLTLTSTSSGICPADTSVTTITYTNAYSVETFIYGSGFFCDNDLSESVPDFSGTSTGSSFFDCEDCDSFNTQNGSFVPGENDSGTYTITYTIPPAGGCAELITSTSFTINPAPEVSAEAITYPHTDLCNLLPIILQGSAENSTGITWSVDIPNGSFDDTTSLNSTYTPPGNYIGELECEITAQGQPGCTNASNSFTFNLLPAPDGSIATLPDHLCAEDTVNLSVSDSPFNAFYHLEWTASNIIDSNSGSQVQFSVGADETVSVTLAQSIHGTCISETTYNIEVFQRPAICDYFELAGAILSVNPCDFDQNYFYQWGCGTSAIEGENNNYLLYSPYLDECNDDFYVAVSFYDSGVCPSYGGNNPTTSLEETDFSELFQVFPNPATDLIRLKSHKGVLRESTLYIADLNGHIISRRIVQNGEVEIVIHTSHFAAGPYFLTIQGDDWMARKTFVVIH